jgi:hypothetical protein
MKNVRKLSVVLGCCLFAMQLAAKDFDMPRAADAKTYAVRDNHPNEHAAIAAVPYTGEKGSIFKGKYEEHDLLPVFVIFTNDNDTPLELSDMTVQFTTVDKKAKISPASDEDIYRKISRSDRRADEASRNPLPIPLPRRGPKVGVKKDVTQEVEAAQFRARAVEPHTTRAGFMFFDVSGIRDPLQGGKIYVTGVRDGNGQELMYFELDLDNGGSVASR